MVGIVRMIFSRCFRTITRTHAGRYVAYKLICHQSNEPDAILARVCTSFIFKQPSLRTDTITTHVIRYVHRLSVNIILIYQMPDLGSLVLLVII